MFVVKLHSGQRRHHAEQFCVPNDSPAGHLSTWSDCLSQIRRASRPVRPTQKRAQHNRTRRDRACWPVPTKKGIPADITMGGSAIRHLPTHCAFRDATNCHGRSYMLVTALPGPLCGKHHSRFVGSYAQTDISVPATCDDDLPEHPNPYRPTRRLSGRRLRDGRSGIRQLLGLALVSSVYQGLPNETPHQRCAGDQQRPRPPLGDC